MFYNWNVIGHKKELALLEQDFRGNNVAHAYLFVGPAKIGKFRVAKAAAGILQCPNDFCHRCPICIQIEKKCQPDTIELPDDNESIKISQVREIIARLNMTGQSRHKILLIENTGRLTDEASNCLLKILEEPPEKTIFIFTANQRRDVLPTIASRMRIIHFRKLPDEVLRQSLRKQYPEVDDETLDHVLLLSLGRSGSAIKLLSNPEQFQDLKDLYRHIQFLETQASPGSRIVAMQELSKDSQRVKSFLSLLIHHFRRSLLEQKSVDEKMRALGILKEIHRTLDLLSRNVNPRLLLENIMLQL